MKYKITGLLSIVCCIAFQTMADDSSEAKKDEPQTTITCDGNMDMHYEENKAIFHDRVVVEDPRMKMTADEMTVYFDPKSKDIEKVIAEGSVNFKKEDKSAKAAHAVYTALDGKVILTGSPMVKKGENVMTGEKITFYRDDSRMIIEPSAKLILYSSDQKDLNDGWL